MFDLSEGCAIILLPQRGTDKKPKSAFPERIHRRDAADAEGREQGVWCLGVVNGTRMTDAPLSRIHFRLFPAHSAPRRLISRKGSLEKVRQRVDE